MGSGEYSGYDSDLRLERRWKRRCVANQCFNPKPHSNSPMVIASCKPRERSELSKYGNFSSIRNEHIDYNDNDVDGVTDPLNGVGDDNHDKDKDEDPQYKMFLNNLKKKGNSYALEVFLDNGVREVINYEGSHFVEHERNHEDQSDYVDEDYYKLLNPSVGETNGSFYIGPGSGDHEDDYVDVEYCRFLSLACGGIRRHSDANPGLEVDHLVEPENVEEDKGNGDCQQYLTFLDGYVIDDEDTMNRIDDEDTMNRIDDEDTLNRIADGPERPDEVKESELGRECDQGDDDVAEDYLRFLDLLEKDGEDMMYKIVDCPERFDQDEDSEFDLEIAAMEKDPCNGGYFNPVSYQLLFSLFWL